jgi:hypothetical protein
MTISIAELADLPTVPTLSRALREAAQYADHGPHLAIRRALFGATTFEDFAAVITPEHAIAEGIAFIVVGGLVDPEVTDHGWPDETWEAGYFAARVGAGHAALTAWAATHTTGQLTHLFEAAADRAQGIEATGQ